jgi:hypothetical protein
MIELCLFGGRAPLVLAWRCSDSICRPASVFGSLVSLGCPLVSELSTSACTEPNRAADTSWSNESGVRSSPDASPLIRSCSVPTRSAGPWLIVEID